MRAFCQSLYRRLFANTGKTALTLTVLVAVIYLIIVFIVPQRTPYIVIDATTLSLRFEVTRPDLVSIPIVEALASDPLPTCGLDTSASTQSVVGALLRPATHVHMRYRWSKQAVVIELLQRTGSTDPSGELIFADDERCDLPSEVAFRMPTKSIFSEVETHLPIAGPTELGIELQVPQPPGSETRPSAMLLDGTVKVFGRPLLPHLKGNLYPAQGADFPLPTGGRLASGKPLSLSGTSTDAPPWFGLARIGPDGFKVSATTESKTLQFYRPGFSGDAETFAIGLLVRLFNDPSLAVLSVGLVVFSLVGQLVSAWMGIWRRPRRRSREAPHMPAREVAVEEPAEEKPVVADRPVDTTEETAPIEADEQNAGETAAKKV